MAFIFYNANPKKFYVKDCVVRGISTVLNKDYLETRKDLNKFKKDNYLDNYRFTSSINKYMLQYSTKVKFITTGGKPKMKVREFEARHPKGTYLLAVKNHVTACINGDVLDTWDCTNLTLEGAWRIRKNKIK